MSAAVLGLCRGEGGPSSEGGGASRTLAAELVDRLEASLRSAGVAWTDGFLGGDEAKRIRREILDLDASTTFEPGQLAGGRAGKGERVVSSAVRADRCAFASLESRESRPALGALLALCDDLVGRLAARASLPFLPLDHLRHRGQPQLAIYPPVSAGYARHVDNPNKNGRRLTLCYYVNEACLGGDLECERTDGTVVALAPEADRLVLFASELVPHQVKPTRGGDALRVAVTLWYCDYDELLAAEADDEPRGQTPTEMAALAAIAARRRET